MKLKFILLSLILTFVLINSIETKQEGKYGEINNNYGSKVKNNGKLYGLFFSLKEDNIYNSNNNNHKETNDNSHGSGVVNYEKDHGWFFMSPKKEGEYLYNSKVANNGGYGF
ncbi:hypothetical protein ACTFIZ_006903 [Dictyostelium cf. discoideum]